jgi:signal transduction histidine kinase
LKIQKKLSLQFTIIFAIILFSVLSGIYYLTEKNREANFYNRLNERALTVAQIFLAEDNLTTEKFREVQKKYSRSLPEEEFKIYDEKGNAVFINQSEAKLYANKISEVVRNKNIKFSDKNMQGVGLFYVDNSGNFVVFATAKDIYEFNHMKQLRMIMLLLFMIALIIVYFIGQWFAKLALEPVNRIINEVRYIRSTSLDKRLNTGNGRDELADLSITINTLLEHLEQSFNAQRSFVANASHELRTPLTSMTAQLEVILRNDRTKDEYETVLQNLLSETSRINELINALFALVNANIDTDEFGDIQLDEIAWQIKEEWENNITGSKISLDFSSPYESSEYKIQGNATLLFIGVGNIVKNAVKFSSNQIVYVKISSEPGFVTMSVADNGIGIDSQELARIFDPFFRGSNTNGFEGMGVGLSLSEKILKLHNASISVESIFGKGSVFTIRFRKADHPAFRH